ncbi:MAG: hypothetical protein ABI823_22000 [Bryobacteraceae bacterium]
MQCFLCGKKIGFLRYLVDREYCSAEHRHQARFVSARALRDAEEDEPWSVMAAKKKAAKSGATAGQTASVFAFLAIAVLILAVLVLPSGGSGGGGGGSISVPSPEQGKPAGLIARAGDYLASSIRGSAPISLREDFRSGFKDWATTPMRGSRSDVFGDSAGPDSVRTGSLHIWKRSTSMANYQMEFMGQLEKKSLAWAFRASDGKNFYATKLVMTKPGPLPNAGLIRFAMVDGREFDRVQIPLPLTIEKGGSYRIRLSVQDDRFLTFVNGQVISSWTDRRLRRGGVGFFAEEGEQASVKWVTLSERDSILGRVLAHFSLFVIPGSGLGLE